MNIDGVKICTDNISYGSVNAQVKLWKASFSFFTFQVKRSI